MAHCDLAGQLVDGQVDVGDEPAEGGRAGDERPAGVADVGRVGVAGYHDVHGAIEVVRDVEERPGGPHALVCTIRPLRPPSWRSTTMVSTPRFAELRDELVDGLDFVAEREAGHARRVVTRGVPSRVRPMKAIRALPTWRMV